MYQSISKDSGKVHGKRLAGFSVRCAMIDAYNCLLVILWLLVEEMLT